MEPRTLDHVAVWVTDRERVADEATRYLGMHVIERTERFTLVGSDARHGKLTLFGADGPREQGVLKHVALRVSDLAAAVDRLPSRTPTVELPGGLRIEVVEAPTPVEWDLDHVALKTAVPEKTAADYLNLGFARAQPGPSGAPRVEVGGAFVEFHAGDPGASDRPLLHHIAVLVDSADEHIAEAHELGIEVDDVVDAPNTYAAFLRGPDGVRIEYVEHKPTFSLV